jgi:uncharacterized protein YhbP (UPF0306 family)
MSCEKLKVGVCYNSNMLSNIEQVIREYLPGVVHMSLATSNNNVPWISELHFMYDADLHIYFRSLPSRRHSLDIKENPNVSGNVIKQHTIGEKVRGVYFEGKAELIENVTMQSESYKAFTKRFGPNKDVLEEANTENGHKFYKITVENYYVFDSISSNPSKKYKLSWH